MNKRKRRKTLLKDNIVFTWTSIAMSAILSAMLLTAIFAFCVVGDGKDICGIKADGGAIFIPMEDVSSGKAGFYRYNNGRKDIIFFVVRGSDGIFHTAFDACEVCYLRSDKGYIQEGDYMVCLGCRERYAINMIDQVNGVGCRPHHLSHTMERGKIVVKTADLEKGCRYFP